MPSPSPDLLGKFSLLPRADIILRSCDSHDFPVQKLYVIDGSPVLAERIMATTGRGVNSEEATANVPVDGETEREISLASLPVVRLPESHTIVSSLLTFLFPVPPVLPLTTDQTLELLSVAQKYQATAALARIRDRVRHEPKFICFETALRVYSLAWKYGLLEEALLAAEETLKRPMTISDFEDEIDSMPGAALGELWKYRQQVTHNFGMGLRSRDGFYNSELCQESVFRDCVDDRDDDKPPWLGLYLNSVIEEPACLDITTFHLALSSHILPPFTSSPYCCFCDIIPGETIRKIWTALTAVFHESIRKAELDFSLAQREIHSQSSTLVTTTGAPPSLEGLNMQGADVILQSSDLISFRVHKSTMAISSPFFNDLFSLPQPCHGDGEVVDGLPVVHVSEDAEVLHSLLPLLYPIPSVIPDSYKKTLALLAASEKYNMDTVSSTIRCNIVLPTTEAAFHAYAIASSKRLIPELETAARHTLDHPMTFETIVDALPLFEGSALRDLIHFRKRCHDNLLSFLVDLRDGNDSLSKVWNSCRRTKRSFSTLQSDQGNTAGWFRIFFWEHTRSLQETYTCSLPKYSSLREEFTNALRAHISETQCSSCSTLYATEGEALRDKWLRRVSEIRDKEPFWLDTGAPSLSPNLGNTDV